MINYTCNVPIGTSYWDEEHKQHRARYTHGVDLLNIYFIVTGEYNKYYKIKETLLKPNNQAIATAIALWIKFMRIYGIIPGNELHGFINIEPYIITARNNYSAIYRDNNLIWEIKNVNH